MSSKMSLRYTKKTASNVPKCNRMLNEILSSGLPAPNTFWKIAKCPEEEIGKNSASPWMSPYSMDSQIDMEGVSLSIIKIIISYIEYVTINM